MKHRMTSRSRGAAALMWGCLLLYAARVVGQFESYALAPSWLPDAHAWTPSWLPYPVLLPLQIALLMVLAVLAWSRRVRTGRVAAAHPVAALTLRMLAGLYFIAVAASFAIDLRSHGAYSWRLGAISAASHCALALFVLVGARASAVPGSPQPGIFDIDDADEPHGDVPALAAAMPRTREYRAGY